MDLPSALLFQSLTTKPVRVFLSEYGGGRGMTFSGFGQNKCIKVWFCKLQFM